ncbi:hypothetical protein EK904_006467 [Melospiza melodia maxima]|nr:hypothetical protein EK904_006467 [Melospiza melodia maxima]
MRGINAPVTASYPNHGGNWHPPSVTDLESSQLAVCKLHCPTDPLVALPFRSTDVPGGSQPINIDLFLTKPFHLEKCVSQRLPFSRR